MAQLDLSNHQLNFSASKQKYSFSKGNRFYQPSSKPLCDSFYDLPSTRSKRGASLGYGNKNMGLTDSKTPAPGTYDLGSDIDPEKHRYSSASFGFGREQMNLQGPLGQVKYYSKMPGPGSYQNLSTRDQRAPSLKSRLPDYSLQKSVKNPGPGSYKHENMGTSNYYVTSKFRNYTNGKMSQVARLDPIFKRSQISPAEYKPVDSINTVGRYNQAKHRSSKSCVFSKSQRLGLADTSKIFVPGPGQYPAFSVFG